jgi:hypothetical protein
MQTSFFRRITLSAIASVIFIVHSYAGHMPLPNDTTPRFIPAREINKSNLRVNLGTTVTKRQWLTTMNLLMLTLKLKINNHTATAFEFNRDNTFKFLKPNDCTLEIGLPGKKVTNTFDLAANRMNPATMYFVDIRNRTQSVDVAGSDIKITINFEEGGHEVLANCIDNIICGGGMWWADLERLKTEIYLTPTIENGKITYSRAKAVVSGQIKSAGFNVVVGYLEKFENQGVFNMASQVFTNILNRPDIKNAFTEALNSNLSRLPIELPNPLRSVRIEANGDLVFNKPAPFNKCIKKPLSVLSGSPAILGGTDILMERTPARRYQPKVSMNDL